MLENPKNLKNQEEIEKINNVTNSNTLEGYGLKFAGMGVENICFEINGSTKKLIKVNKQIFYLKIMQLIEDPMVRCIPYSVLEQKESFERYNQIEKEVESFFGAEHVLNQGMFRAKIPLNKEIITSVLGKDKNFLANNLEENKIYEIEMLMHSQLIAEELKDPVRFQTESYNTSSIEEQYFMESKNVTEGLKKIERHINKEFIPKIFKNEKYQKLVKEITEKVIQYTKKTGTILDIFGRNNITLFTDKNNNANYHILDVVLPSASIGWEKTLKTDPKLSELRKAYTYYYALKTLSEKLNIPEKIELKDLNYFKDAEIPTEWPANHKY